MLAKRVLLLFQPKRCRAYSNATETQTRKVTVLPDASVDTFRSQAYGPAIPVLLPRHTFQQLPAVQKWFAIDTPTTTLKRSYLARYGSTIVPLEISNNEHFSRTEQSLSFFLECVHASSSSYKTRPNRYFSAYVPGARAVKRMKLSNDFFSAAAVTVAQDSTLYPSVTTPSARVYLAQAAITSLPQGLRDDVPTPDLVLKTGKGDVYDSSIWLGEAPTYTPLHRDPNPNLFVQLAGTKVVRLVKPEVGRSIFAKVQERIEGSASDVMRGEEMMKGAEKKALESEIWDDDHVKEHNAPVWEAQLNAGDGLFIPKGWWHSVKGIGTGMTGSVNWWFR
ncbi:hypothetical protein LTR09_002644 [Extremus antarcticus]|uniref:JmjC domain-containing protein n=1 Tax=Extremus antarcticus TaxID=702011 RepID=A0AAJ0GET3_9PEZI|nr:hypothetical protein LTR09_002644 [Extremus antarcticus]